MLRIVLIVVIASGLTDICLGNVSQGKGMLFGNFGQRLVKYW